MEPTASGHRELVARALASAGAVLVAYVGVVHEVIGTTLHPEGPAFFGGSVGLARRRPRRLRGWGTRC